MKNIMCTVVFAFDHKGKSYLKGDSIELQEQAAAKLISDGMVTEGEIKVSKKKSKKNKED